MSARVTLIGRPQCHLCEVARGVIERVCADLGTTYEEINIDERPDLLAKWSDEVPVTLVDGKQHDFWRVSETRLRAALH